MHALLTVSKVEPEELLRIAAKAAPESKAMSSCSMVPAVANARYHILVGDKMSDVVRVRYTCYKGFELDGEHEIECYGDDGKWDPEPPTCIPSEERLKQCGEPPFVSNGIVFKLPEKPGEPKLVQYMCENGYGMIGNHTLYCIDGVWRSASTEAEPPKCVPWEIKSSTSPVVLTSTLETTKEKASTFNQRERQCGQPKDVEGAFVWLLDGSIDDPIEIEYRCHEKGHSIPIDTRFVCSDGQWHRRNPSPNFESLLKCIPNEIIDQTYQLNDPLTMPQAEERNGKQILKKVLMKISISNVSGHILDCGPEPLVLHATSHRISHNVVKYECMSSLTMVGSSVIYCLPIGLWSEPPYCVYVPITSTASTPFEEAKCSARVPVVRNAIHQIINGTRNHPKIIRYHCLSGYILEGPSDVHCKNGVWARGPKCVKNENGTIIFKEEAPAHGQQELPLSPPLAEHFNPSWALPSIAKEVGDYNTFNFDNYYGKIPVTTPQQESYCTKMPHFLNGYFLAVPSPIHRGAVKSIRFVCKPGYLLFGPESADCLPGEQWTEIPYCEEVPKPVRQSCKPVPHVLGGKFAVLEGSQMHPTKVRYFCDQGLRMFAFGGTAGILSCDMETGNWIPEPPNCDPQHETVDDTFIVPDINLRVSGSEKPLFTAVTKSSSQPTATVPSTTPSTTSSTTTTTRPTTTQPMCQHLPALESSKYVLITEGPSAIAVLVCNEGFQMPSGVLPIIRCRNGEWDPNPLPTCEHAGKNFF